MSHGYICTSPPWLYCGRHWIVLFHMVLFIYFLWVPVFKTKLRTRFCRAKHQPSSSKSRVLVTILDQSQLVNSTSDWVTWPGRLQEESMIGDLDGMLPQHPLKMVGVVSECQESRLILTKFANGQTLYQASHSLIWWNNLVKYMDIWLF